MKVIRIFKNIFLLLFIASIILCGLYLYKAFIKDKDNNEPAVLEKINNFDYTLENDKPEYYKDLFSELKDCLNKSDIDYEIYSKVVAKMFVYDLFNINNKSSSSDIGGLNFVYSDFKNDYIEIVKTSLYNNVKSNIYNDRNQDLPIVNDVKIDEFKETVFSYKGNDFSLAYLINLSIIYEKDLGYPQKCELIIAKNENGKMEIVKLK